jgi:sugar-specific transcriptional regulator TrmB
MTKRTYNRRSTEERIADYQRQIEELRQRKERREREDVELTRGYEKLHKALAAFIQLAHNRGRADISNMVQAFTAGLQRQVHMSVEEPRRRRGSDADES